MGKNSRNIDDCIFGSPVQGVSCTRRKASRGVFLRRLNTDDFASETEKRPQPQGD